MGITQEQHPARCRLFARWKELDFPILWDPFNLTGSKVVPNYTLVDERGVVRAWRAGPDDLEAFLATAYEAPSAAEPTEPRPDARMLRVLEDRDADPTPLVETLAGAQDDPAAHFRRGVALRMRQDRGHGRPGDFGAAVKAWRRALDAEPSQYIWRRRLQQYGPLEDKPYPFFQWIEEAQAELVRRGEEPEPLDASLTLSERSLGVGEGEPQPIDASPDPKGGLPFDADGLLTVETAVVFSTQEATRVGRLHVVVGPRDAKLAGWNGGADPLVVWTEPGMGVQVRPRGLRTALPPSVERGTRTFELDVVLSEDQATAPTLRLIVLAPVCRTEDGTCLYVRHEHEVSLAR